MKITINDLIRCRAFRSKNIQQIKKWLYHCKKSGILFFEENVFELTSSTPFNIYYALSPYKSSDINPFPIPIKDFTLFDDLDEDLEFMRHYFEKYYKKRVLDNRYFLFYETEPYVGIHYIWYYRATKERNDIFAASTEEV
ncbi:hypothetical protein T260_16610 [Geobacillus thermopakistaniensis]|jgi:hypothetical protein|uniref:Uncharacterized protein n=1 Tax=Geobacillus thermopakistaniensis (strain MAS1) TaxID=1408282 RepID=A0A7U9J8I4_GEOTM|nr:hypothetical protein [Geobacillus sp. MAS1]ESU70879.1 hypothetical protein T260_16610 [Geobacillus sp. MAS1]